jgi:cytochrome c556
MMGVEPSTRFNVPPRRVALQVRKKITKWSTVRKQPVNRRQTLARLQAALHPSGVRFLILQANPSQGTENLASTAPVRVWPNFKAGMTKFEEESAKLAEAAKSAKAVDEVKAQFLETAKTCKGCHENFKED